LNVTDKANIFNVEFSLMLFVTQISKGIDDNTTNDIEHNLWDDDEEGEVKQECREEIIARILKRHIVPECTDTVSLT